MKFVTARPAAIKSANMTTTNKLKRNNLSTLALSKICIAAHHPDHVNATGGARCKRAGHPILRAKGIRHARHSARVCSGKPKSKAPLAIELRDALAITAVRRNQHAIQSAYRKRPSRMAAGNGEIGFSS